MKPSVICLQYTKTSSNHYFVYLCKTFFFLNLNVQINNFAAKQKSFLIQRLMQGIK